MSVGRETTNLTPENSLERSFSRPSPYGEGRLESRASARVSSGVRSKKERISKGISKGQKISREKKELSRHFRKNLTESERVFWEIVRNKKLGYKFRRQQVIDKFVVDFFCEELNLVVEVEGGIHKKQKGYDKFREEALKQKGLNIFRIENEKVLNKDNLLEKLMNVMDNLTPENSLERSFSRPSPYGEGRLESRASARVSSGVRSKKHSLKESE